MRINPRFIPYVPPGSLEMAKVFLSCQCHSAHAVDQMQLSVLTDDEVTSKKYKHESDIFYAFQVSGISSSLICVERLFCDSPAALHFSEVADLFREMADLHLIIKGSEQTQTDVEVLKAAFVDERADDKILALHKDQAFAWSPYATSRWYYQRRTIRSSSR
jgi:hypothetical protein